MLVSLLQLISTTDNLHYYVKAVLDYLFELMHYDTKRENVASSSEGAIAPSLIKCESLIVINNDKRLNIAT